MSLPSPIAGHLLETLHKAAAAHQGGDLRGAEKLYKSILQADPAQFDALHLLGVVRLQQRRFADAIELLQRALAQNAASSDGHYHMGMALAGLNRPAEALGSFDQAVALDARATGAWDGRGQALLQLGRHAEAETSFQRSLDLLPLNAGALNGKGSALAGLQRYDEAVKSWQAALRLDPTSAPTLANIGRAMTTVGRYPEALDYLKRALALDPVFIQALRDLMTCVARLSAFSEALPLLDRAIATAPKNAELHCGRGLMLQALGRYAEATASLEKALSLAPNNSYVLYEVVQARRFACAWPETKDLARLKQQVAAGAGIEPFSAVVLLDDIALTAQNARTYVDRQFGTVPTALNAGRVGDAGKIRVAYVSPDFRQHPGAALVAELIERHDRSRFEIVGVSYGPDDHSPLRKRVAAAFDKFEDVSRRGDREIAAWMAQEQIDIAVDLTGHCELGRPGILAYRGAPIQVNYLGYPGTMGATFVDYILADPIVIPVADQVHYVEKVAYLPDCYQVTDTTRAVSSVASSRQDAGLPAHGFVFCSFNHAFKITPDVFDVWMRLLKRVEGSVLWLLCGRDDAQKNLRARARAREVDPSRLIFAPRVTADAHLARHALADLFLDTTGYNAHTTASDALWAGLPLVTCLGTTFPARVAGSIVTAAGLPDLAVTSLAAYEELALTLATDAGRLSDVRARVAQARHGSAMFDTDRFRRHIEAAYQTMIQIARAGEPPRGFAVPPS